MDQRKLIYAAYRLKFLTPVHIGPDNGQNPLHSSGTSLHSDTFFSALCVEASHQSDQAVESLIENAEQNHILLSDLFPYRNDELFLEISVYPYAVAREAGKNGADGKRQTMGYLEYQPSLQLQSGGNRILHRVPPGWICTPAGL